MNPKVRRPLTTIILAIILWWVIVEFFHIPEYKFPSPVSVFEQSPDTYMLLLHHFSVTLLEVVLGMIAGVFLGLSTAIIFFWCPRVKDHFYFSAQVINAIPIVAIAAIIVIILGSGIQSKLVTAVIAVYFPLVCHAYNGLLGVDRASEKSLEIINASRWQKLVNVQLPHAAAEIFNALETAALVVVVGVFSGEMFASNEGLGFYVLNLKYRMDTPKVFLAVFVTGALGIFLASVVVIFKKKLIYWHPSVQKGR